MKICFIICEYNPFHNGHSYHINETKKALGCDFVVCLMSGDIVQRGQLAIADKYTRASWAIKSGADLVIELPCEFVLGSAELFALGAIKTAQLFEGNKFLSFGSECGNLDILRRLANFLSPQNEKLQALIKEKINDGSSYAAATEAGAKQYSQENNCEDFSSYLSSSNDILAISYLQAIESQKADISPFAIQRIGQAYKDNVLQQNFSSATALRKAMTDSNNAELAKNMPDYVFQNLNFSKNSEERYFAILKFKLLNTKDFDGIFGLKEGIENRILTAAKKCETYSDFVAKICTKRYSATTVQRLLLSILLENKSNISDLKLINPIFVNVLAINKNSLDLLGFINGNIITKPSDAYNFKAELSLTDKIHNLFEAANYPYQNRMKIIEM